MRVKGKYHLACLVIIASIVHKSMIKLFRTIDPECIYTDLVHLLHHHTEVHVEGGVKISDNNTGRWNFSLMLKYLTKLTGRCNLMLKCYSHAEISDNNTPK